MKPETIENFKPVQDYVVVELIVREKTEGGILIPEGSQKKEDDMFMEVLATGPDCKFTKTGDWVLLHPQTMCTRIKVGSKTIVIPKEYDIMGKVENTLVV